MRSRLDRLADCHVLKWRKSHAVIGTRPVLENGCNMRRRAVALVLFEVVEGILSMNVSHDAVSRDLGAYRSCSNNKLDAISFDD